jgi:hypothetical protein
MADEKGLANDSGSLKDGHVVRQLDERRRAALAEIDNAPFSFVPESFFYHDSCSHVAQVVPRQSLSRSWCWLLHRRVSLPVLRHEIVLTVFSSYDIFAINIASTMLGYVYGHGTSFTSMPSCRN